MNLIRLLVCGILLASLSVRADEKFRTLKVGDECYSNVTVTLVTATDVYFSHAGGLCNLKLEDLSADLQKRFHYDPSRARNAEQAQTLASTRYYNSIGNALRNAVLPAGEDAAGLDFLPKIPGGVGGLIPPRLYLDLFVLVGAAFFLTNVFSYFRGQRNARKQNLNHLLRRMESMATIDLSNPPPPRQITTAPQRVQ
jgi:hypothetical protein